MSMEGAAPAAGSSLPSSYAVCFSNPAESRWLQPPPANYWKWFGAGQLQLEPQQMVLRGFRRRTLLPKKQQAISYLLADIVDVNVRDAMVSVRIRNHAGKHDALAFWAPSPAAAAAIAEQLPRVQTPGFARQLAEAEAFTQALTQFPGRGLVTPALVAANLIVFGLTVGAGAGLLEPHGEVLVRWGSNYGPLTLQGEWWRLGSSMFLHFGLVHVLLNMWALWSMGALTEKLFGSGRYLLLYLFSGLTGSLASVLWNNHVNSAGASGAIFGVIGGLLAFMINPATRVPASVANAQRNSAAVFVFYNLVNGFSHQGIDNACHIGGLVGGFAMGWLLATPLNEAARRQSGQRLALAAGAGIALLAGMFWPLAHPSPLKLAEREFRLTLDDYIKEEDAVNVDAKELDAQRRDQKITEAQWGQRISQVLVPQWQAMARDLERRPLPAESAMAPLRAAIVSLVSFRTQGLKLLANAAETHNADAAAKANELLKRGEAQAVEAQTLAKKIL